MKHLNKDLKPLAEAQFPDRGAFLLGEDFGKRAKTTADNISALKGVQAKKPRYHFSGSGDSNRRSSMPQSHCKTWGTSYIRVKSVFSRLDSLPKPSTSQKRPFNSRPPNQNRALSSQDAIGLAFRNAKGPRLARGSLQTSRPQDSEGTPALGEAPCTLTGRMACRKNSKPLQELESNNFRQVGDPDSEGLPVGICQNANPKTSTHDMRLQEVVRALRR